MPSCLAGLNQQQQQRQQSAQAPRPQQQHQQQEHAQQAQQPAASVEQQLDPRSIALVTTDVCLRVLHKDLLPLGPTLLIQYDLPSTKVRAV